jgi:hypothetical protein
MSRNAERQARWRARRYAEIAALKERVAELEAQLQTAPPATSPRPETEAAPDPSALSPTMEQRYEALLRPLERQYADRLYQETRRHINEFAQWAGHPRLSFIPIVTTPLSASNRPG